MPRGATQARKIFSLKLRLLRRVAMKIESGLDTSWITANKTIALTPKVLKLSGSMRLPTR